MNDEYDCFNSAFAGFHSITSAQALTNPVARLSSSPVALVYTPSYPAYIVSYTTCLCKDPYRDLNLCVPSTLGDRCDAHEFARYRRWYRPVWKTQDESCETNGNTPAASYIVMLRQVCPWTSRLHLLCIKQVEASASLLQPPRWMEMRLKRNRYFLPALSS